MIRFNLEPLDTIATLPLLGHTITFNISNWEYLYCNMSKVQWQWGMVEKLLVKVDATV